VHATHMHGLLLTTSQATAGMCAMQAVHCSPGALLRALLSARLCWLAALLAR
jgi:hypothetical protein